jgi:hypothetical protein
VDAFGLLRGCNRGAQELPSCSQREEAMDEKSTNLQRRPMPKPVKWTGYKSLRTEHATNLVVQSHGSELTLLFFELRVAAAVYDRYAGRASRERGGSSLPDMSMAKKANSLLSQTSTVVYNVVYLVEQRIQVALN